MPIQEPIKRVETKWPGADHAVEETHPSFGQLQISRVTIGMGGSKANLYGSSIKHNNVIALRIYASRHIIEGDHDWYFENGELIEVWLSPSQFAEAITTLNVGGGVPCTIHSMKGMKDYIETPEMNSKQEQHSEHFKTRMVNFSNRIQALQKNVEESLCGEKVPGKKERQEIAKNIGFVLQEVRNNIPFFETQFKKQMEQTVMEAKAEIEAFVDHAIVSTGLKALQGNKDEKLIELTEGGSHE